MIVYKRIPLSFLLRINKWYLLYIVLISTVTWYLSIILDFHSPTLLLPSMAVFGTVLSLFLAFRTNEAYNRWWEARQLWGDMINASRVFGKEVLTLISNRNTRLEGVGLESFRKKLIYRHIAYINALRLHLRRQDEYGSDLKPFLNDGELEVIGDAKNIPTMINIMQAREITEQVNSGDGNEFKFVQIHNTLNRFFDIQGGCERIKTTVFPRLYAFYTTAFTWIFATGLVISLVDEFDWQTLILRAIVAYVFIQVDQLGADLKNPFEMKMNDTPMTALCRTIEIDLRQMLGEKDLPAPVEPEGGVLN